MIEDVVEEDLSSIETKTDDRLNTQMFDSLNDSEQDNRNYL